MLRKIKSLAGSALFSLECGSVKLCLEAAVKTGANLYGAHLSGADLSGANLSGAHLSGADLSGADLSGANLSRANLSGAHLSGADLYGADLSRANLYGADLSGADLSGADLSGADLSGANLSGAHLSGADLSGARGLAFQIPEGDLIGWKKVEGCIVRLRIPFRARRTGTPIGRKCRAELAEVLEIIGPHDPAEGVTSPRGGGLTYRVGETVYPDSYDDDTRVECTHGIHFFLTRQEAEDY